MAACNLDMSCCIRSSRKWTPVATDAVRSRDWLVGSDRDSGEFGLRVEDRAAPNWEHIARPTNAVRRYKAEGIAVARGLLAQRRASGESAAEAIQDFGLLVFLHGILGEEAVLRMCDAVRNREPLAVEDEVLLDDFVSMHPAV